MFIPSFCPRFADKFDRQSSDLTQFTSHYAFTVKPTTNQPGIDLEHLRIKVKRVFR